MPRMQWKRSEQGVDYCWLSGRVREDNRTDERADVWCGVVGETFLVVWCMREAERHWIGVCRTRHSRIGDDGFDDRYHPRETID